MLPKSGVYFLLLYFSFKAVYFHVTARRATPFLKRPQSK